MHLHNLSYTHLHIFIFLICLFIRHLLLGISWVYLIHLFILYQKLLLLQNNFGRCSFEVDRYFTPSCLIIIMILTVIPYFSNCSAFFGSSASRSFFICSNCILRVSISAL